MERGPLPPHERTWRHPSELAASESAQLRADPGSRSLRTTALVAGTLGLVVVGVLAIMVTPSSGGLPMAVGTEATLVDPGTLATVAVFGTAAPTGSAEAGTAQGVARVELDRPPISMFATTIVATTPAAGPVVAPLATLLESGIAVVTAKSVAGYQAGEQFAIRLASGRTLQGELVSKLGNAAVVTVGVLVASEQSHAVADSVPGASTLVTILSDPPLTVRLDELAATEVPEGTAVIDGDGRLIGLCTLAADGHTSLAAAVDADHEPVGPSTSAPVASPTSSPAPPSAPPTSASGG